MQIRAEPIHAVPKGADPEFVSEMVLDAVNSVLEATIAMRVRRAKGGSLCHKGMEHIVTNSAEEGLCSLCGNLELGGSIYF
jgi:hypothetical protein